ncbi:MAG: Tim44 domain-containing protein [Betaproteobacteria bacterium]|nr:MAG: Tim44 domain-containing protein [Betaproteobacteria bacterium]
MKRTSILLLAAFAALTLTLSDLADAARMGGGRSFGAQRQSVTPSKPAPPAAAPANSAAAQPATPAAGTAPAPAAAPSGASRWLGPIAGIAAGLGLAALLSHFGLSEGFGSLLLVALVIFAGVFLVRMLMRRRETAKPLQYAGASVRPGYENQARPVWSDAPKVEPPVAPAAGAPGFGVARKPLPQGFDAAGFATEAKRQFIRLQGSYDTADRAALSAVMTSEMYTEIGRELDERGPHQATEIVTLDADVLDVSTEGDKHWASVRFTGLVREDGEPQPKSIDEVWNLVKPVRGTSGWLLAGITQLA